MKYIVVIPARNEETRLSQALNSIIEQSIRPILCLIVNDGSTDHTDTIITEYERKFDWICHITTEHKEKGTWSLSKEDVPHFADVVQQGIISAINICKFKGFEYEYIAKVDADFILPVHYFEEVNKKFSETSSLGIASGDVYYVDTSNLAAGKKSHQKILSDTPTDGARVYRKACFDEIGGIPLVGSPDSAALAIARNLGWKTARFRDIHLLATRKSVGGGNAWRGYMLAGYNAYVFDYNPMLVLIRAIGISCQSPHYHCLGWLWGYSLASFRRLPKVGDQRIRNYYRKQRLHELAMLLFKKLNRNIVNK